jgi:hypothetical protein
MLSIKQIAKKLKLKNVVVRKELEIGSRKWDHLLGLREQLRSITRGNFWFPAKMFGAILLSAMLRNMKTWWISHVGVLLCERKSCGGRCRGLKSR